MANGHRICNAFRYKIRIYEAIVLVGNRVKVCALVLAHVFVNTSAQHITRVIENCVSVPAFAPVFGTYTVLFLVHFTSIWYLYCYKIGTAPSYEECLPTVNGYMLLYMSMTSALGIAIDTIPANNIQSTVNTPTIGARTILSQSNEPIVSTHSRLMPATGKHDMNKNRPSLLMSQECISVRFPCYQKQQGTRLNECYATRKTSLVCPFCGKYEHHQ